MKIRLILKKGEDIIDSREIDQFPFVIGRAQGNDLVVKEPHISRHQMTLDLKKGKAILTNQGEKDKVSYNGAPLAEQAFETELTVDISPYTLELMVLKEKKSVNVMAEDEPEELFTIDELSADDGKTRISERPAKAKLIVLKGSAAHESYDIVSSEVIIGRDPACDITIDDSKISREHARILLKDNSFVLVDMNSANGTELNHKPISGNVTLSSGDQIQIGNATLQFALVDENVYALSPVSAPEEANTDATQSGALPHWESYIPSYAPVKKGLFDRHKKLIFSSLTMVLLVMVYMGLNQRPTPTRETAQEKTKKIRTAKNETPDELATLTKADKKYILAKMKEAKNLIKNRQYDQAHITLREIFAIAPNYKRALALEQTIQYTLQLQHADEQKREAQLQSKKLDEEIKYHLSVALNYFNRRQWEKSVETYDKVLELQPDHDEAQKKRSSALSKLVPEKPRIKTVSPTIKRNKKAERLLAEGSKLAQEGKLLKALDTWRNVLKMEQVRPAYYEKADKFIRFTKDKLNEKYLPLVTQAKVLIDSKEYLEAQRVLDGIVKEYPSHEKAKALLEKVSFALHQRARREYTEAIIEENVGRIDSAIRRYKWIINRIPASDDYHKKSQRKLKKYE